MTAQPLSETELKVMKALWNLGSGTVHDISARLRRTDRDRAYTTVLTLLQRLQTKGYVRADAGEVAHTYYPKVSREELLAERLQSLSSELADGTPAPLLTALVEGHEFSAEEIRGFRRLLDEAAKRPKKKATRKKRGG